MPGERDEGGRSQDAVVATTDAGRRRSSAEDADVSQPTRCLADAGAATGRTVVRFRVRPSGDRARGCGSTKVLVLDVPSLGLARTLCTSACGPFLFDSRRDDPWHATFSCHADLLDTAGSVTIADDVLEIEVGSRPPAFGDLGNVEAAAAAGNAQRESIPLRCGQRAEIQPSGAVRGGSEGSL